VRYGPTLALQKISFEVGDAECLLVTGPSGCGKSTLGRVLAGLIPRAIPAEMEGAVRIAGVDVGRQPLPEVAKRVGMVFQNPASQLFHLRVDDEVAFGPRNLGLPEPEIQQRVAWALEAVGLAGYEDRQPLALSGGQQQRVAIAAALAMQPRVLVLDEPTASLDITGTRHVMTALREVRERFGLTLMVIEHRLTAASRLADRVLVLDKGRIAAQGDVQEVLGDRRLLRELGLRRPTEGKLAPWRDLLIADGQGCGKDAILELMGVSAGYDRQPAIHDIDLELYPGEFAALVGENGSGKSTLALTAAGLLKPMRGCVRFSGGRKPRPGLDVSLLFQDPQEQLFTGSVDDEIAFAPRNYSRFNPAQHYRTLAEMDLTTLRGRRPTTLSLGQQQRTALGACLSLRPRLVILDEPTMGQDWDHLERLMEFLQELNRRGTAILLITHDYKLVHRYAERVMLMKEGRIILDGHLRHDLSRALAAD
jgi:energy-coupling factor transporter ATP-binding protein EcfA2